MGLMRDLAATSERIQVGFSMVYVGVGFSRAISISFRGFWCVSGSFKGGFRQVPKKPQKDLALLWH